MNRLVAVITGLHVLLHGIVGCCDHGLSVTSSAAPSCHCHHAQQCDHSEPAGECDLAEHDAPVEGPHECVHASCHWLAGDAPAMLRLLELSAATSLVALTPAIELAPAAEFSPDAGLGQSPALPLRRHLAVGVLLI